MHKNRRISSATALGTLTAAAALLIGLPGALAQAPSPGGPLQGAGSFPGSFIVPGTNTSLHVGGIVQLDMSYTMDGSGASPGAYDNANQNAVPLQGPGVALGQTTNHGIYRFTPQFTRPNIETRTPTPYGEMKTYLEFDFSGSASSNSAGAAAAGATQTPCCGNNSLVRVKQAYGTLGPWLIGLANSNYADLDALPDVLDGNQAGGAMAAAFRTQPQVRYTYLLPDGISISGSVEQYQSSGTFGPAASGVGTANWNNFDTPGMGQRVPAVTATARIDQPWGHTAAHIAIAQSRFVDDPSTIGAGFIAVNANAFPFGSHYARWGYMLSETGHFNTIGKDKISWVFSYGEGAGEYDGATQEAGGQYYEGLVCSSTNNIAAGSSFTCAQPRTFGGNLGYSHWWTDEWRSGVAFGYDHISRPDNITWGTSGGGGSTVAGGVLTAGAANGDAALEKVHMSTQVNLIWTPIPAAQFGLEYRWYHRTVWSGAHGSFNRLAAQALFKF